MSALWERAESIAAGIRRDAGASGDSRIHLHAAARALKVRSVRFVQIPVDGQVEWYEGFPHIKVRADMAETRRRFSLAHELAHVALDHRRTSFRNGTVSAEERLCNAIAAELLIPAGPLRTWLSTESLSMSAVNDYADDLTVSRAALVRRITEAADVKCLLLEVRREPSPEGELLVAEDSVFGRLNRWGGPAPHVVVDAPTLGHRADEMTNVAMWYDGSGYRCDASVDNRSDRSNPRRQRWLLLKNFTRCPDLDGYIPA